jgi:flagellar biosynthesis protein FlhB
MLSTLQRKNLQFAFAIFNSMVHLRAWDFMHTVSQYESDRRFCRQEIKGVMHG